MIGPNPGEDYPMTATPPMPGAAPGIGAGPDPSVALQTPSTDPNQLIQALTMFASDDQQKLQMQQMIEQQQLQQQQRDALMAALTQLVQMIGGGAMVPAGPEAAGPLPSEFAGMGPEMMPAEMAAQVQAQTPMADQEPMMAPPAGMPARGEPIMDPNAIPADLYG